MRIYTNSLSKTIDSVSEDYFFGRKTTKFQREEVALWIASRQGKPGCYADMFAPIEEEQRTGITLFTGEKIGPSASLRHVMGEEASRALILLDSRAKAVREALERATESLASRISHCQPNKAGMFCCGTCDPSLWRHLSVGGLQGCEPWADLGLKSLKNHRTGNGDWKRFPFFYTILALLDMDQPAARHELKYAAARMEAYLRRRKPSSIYIVRREAVLSKALEKI